jgi:hypothetical protein
MWWGIERDGSSRWFVESPRRNVAVKPLEQVANSAQCITVNEMETSIREDPAVRLIMVELLLE